MIGGHDMFLMVTHSYIIFKVGSYWLCPNKGNLPPPHTPSKRNKTPIQNVIAYKVLALVYCNFHGEARFGGWGTEGPKAPTLGIT